VETATATCELGDGGWYAVVANPLYLISGLLVRCKWIDPEFSIFQVKKTLFEVSGEGTAAGEVEAHPQNEVEEGFSVRPPDQTHLEHEGEDEALRLETVDL
jgi:hypothetical protein